MKVAAVIPAGGSGSRLAGSGRSEPPKQYRELAGEPVLLRAIRPFLEHPAVGPVIVALPPEDVADPPIRFPEGVVLVAGGAERGDSVRRALAAVPEDVDLVAIHDGARPLLTRAVLDAALAAAGSGAGVVVAVRVTDTVKRVDPGGAITETVDRHGLWRAQTPQVFPRAMILEAYARAEAEGVEGTDDASLAERNGARVVVVEGDASNLKVTHPADLALAELLLRMHADG